MAGAGRKQFTRERATSSDVQNYLMDQTRMVFASTSARASQVPSPSEGMHCWLVDQDRAEDYVNGAWRGRSDRVAGTYPAQTYAATNNYPMAALTVNPGRPYRVAVHAAMVSSPGSGASGSLRIFDSAAGLLIRASQPLDQSNPACQLYREFDVFDGSPRTFTINLEVLAGAITTYTDERSSFAEAVWRSL